MDESSRKALRQWTLAQPTVSAFIASIVRDFCDRDDILQEVALAVIDSYPSYDASRPFNAWVIGIARNQIGLYLRKRKRERLVFDDDTVNALSIAFSDGGDLISHQLDDLRSCLGLLEGRAAELCRLRYQEDLKPLAISKRVGMTANSVAKALQRIREHLRECVERRAVGSA